MEFEMGDFAGMSRAAIKAAEDQAYEDADQRQHDLTEDINRICAAFRNSSPENFESDDVATVLHSLSGFLHLAGFQELSEHLIDLGDEVKPEDKK